MVVRDGVVNGDIEGFAFFQGLIGGMGWIEGPSAGGRSDGEAIDGSADELITQNLSLIHI